MRARDMFFGGALAGVVMTALVFGVGWFCYDRDASEGESEWQQGRLDSYDLPDVTEARQMADAYLFLLEVVPASILAAWFVGSWLLFGRDSVRLHTLQSHFSGHARVRDVL